MKKPKGHTITRHYYYYHSDHSNNNNVLPEKKDKSDRSNPPPRRTEQSLDVYQPTTTMPEEGSITKTTTNSTPTSSRRPTIVLVMGSGWLGHAPWIYTMTNWWNSSGAITIVELGYTCILVRHRGAFFKIPTFPSWKTLVMVGLLPFFLVCTTSFLLTTDGMRIPSTSSSSFLTSWESWVSALKDDPLWIRSLFSIFFFLLIWYGLYWQSIDAAEIPDMVQDVHQALQYIHTDLEESQIILAGYSSGAHVVSMWLQKQQQKQPQGEGQGSSSVSTTTSQDILPIPNILGILYLSGVLSLDSSFMNLVTLSVFGKWARQIPAPYTAAGESSSAQSPPPPSQQVPSSDVLSTLPPHLFVGCRYETFGVPLLDATFCSQPYAEDLARKYSMQKEEEDKKKEKGGVSRSSTGTSGGSGGGGGGCPTRCLLLESESKNRFIINHWTILQSRELSLTLKEHIPWLVMESSSS